jgi:ATP:ADP antiporter, AAA family
MRDTFRSADCYRDTFHLSYILFSVSYILFFLSSNSFANEINTVDEAKAYYPLFGLVANVALIFSGQYVKLVSVIRAALPMGVDKWGHSLKLLMAAVVASGASLLGVFEYIEQKVLTDPECHATGNVARKKKAKTKMSFGESTKFLAKSPYIRDLATLVVSYG